MTEADSRRAVQALVHALVAAWHRHDADAYAAPFADDAEFTTVFGTVQRGRAAIAAAHAAIFRTMFKDTILAAPETRIRFLRPDVAAIDVAWTMTGARDPEGKAWPERRGLLNQVATAENGVWSIAVSHNMDLPPAAAMAKIQAALGRA